MSQKVSRIERGPESYEVNLRPVFRCHSPPHREQGEERWRDAPEPPARTRPCNPRPWLRPRPITPPATPTTILLSPSFYVTALREHFSRGLKMHIFVLFEEGSTFVSMRKKAFLGEYSFCSIIITVCNLSLYHVRNLFAFAKELLRQLRFCLSVYLYSNTCQNRL